MTAEQAIDRLMRADWTEFLEVEPPMMKALACKLNYLAAKAKTKESRKPKGTTE